MNLRWLCCLILPLAGCASVGEKPHAAMVEAPAAKSSVLWGAELADLGDDRYAKLRPVVNQGRVYAVDRFGWLRCLDVATGKTLWDKRYDMHFSAGPTVADGLILIGTSDAQVLALRESDGTLLWRAPVSSEVLAPPVRGGGKVVVQTVDGHVFGLRDDDGTRVWVHDRTVPVLTLRGTSQPLIVGERVFVGFASGKLVALALLDGKLLWDSGVAVAKGRSELERMVDVDSRLLSADGVVYAVSYQGKIAAFAQDSGRNLWARDMSAFVGMTLAGNQLFVTDADGHLWALDRETGATYWKQEALSKLAVTEPVVIDDYLVVGDARGDLVWLTRTDGRVIAKLSRRSVDDAGVLSRALRSFDRADTLVNFIPEDKAVSGPPSLVGDRLIVSYRDGAIVAIGARP